MMNYPPCLGCDRDDVVTISFKYKRDQETLGNNIPKSCPEMIFLCYDCGANYMSSFNRKLDEIQGRPAVAEVWDKQEVEDLMKSGCHYCGGKCCEH